MDALKAFFVSFKEVLVSKQARRFYWLTANGFIGLVLVAVTKADILYAPIIIALLNSLTKEINNFLSQT